LLALPRDAAILRRFPLATARLSSSSTLSILTNKHAQQVIARHACECRQGIIPYPQRGQIIGLSMENKKRTSRRVSQARAQVRRAPVGGHSLFISSRIGQTAVLIGDTVQQGLRFFQRQPPPWIAGA
jgi:hypothetical protein